MSSSFKPLTQNVTFLMADGITQVSLAVSNIDSWFYYNAKLCILYGAQLGACLIMFTATAVLTKESKRRTPVYILNLLSLALGSLRALFLALYCVSTWTEFYAYFTMDFSRIPRSAYATSIAGTVVPLLMTITVNSSLVLQAHVVTKLMNRRYIWMVSALSCLVLLLAVGFRFAEVVTNSMAIMSANNYFSQAWITTGALATETISIWFFSTIFTGKLIWTVHVRKQLGFRKWTNLQLLAAMGGCTMIIPSAFAILEYSTPNSFPEAGTLALTMVALLLPLSSLWAGMTTTEAGSSLNIAQLWGSPHLPDKNYSDSRGKTFGSQSSGPPSTFLSERKGSTAPITAASTIETIPKAKVGRDSTEVDLELMGVRVDRSYGVHSGRGFGSVGMA